MAFNPQEFQKHIEDADKTLMGGGREMALDNLKGDMMKMTPDERLQAADLIRKNNEHGGTQLSLKGDVRTGNFKIQAAGQENTPLKMIFGDGEAESQ